MATRKVGGEMARSLDNAAMFNDIPENKVASPKQLFAASGKMASLQGLNTGKVWYAMFKQDSSHKTKKLTHGDVNKILSAKSIDDVDTKYTTRFKSFTKDRQPVAKTSTPVKATKAAPAVESKKIKDLEKQISDLTKLVTNMVAAQKAFMEDSE